MENLGTYGNVGGATSTLAGRCCGFCEFRGADDGCCRSSSSSFLMVRSAGALRRTAVSRQESGRPESLAPSEEIVPEAGGVVKGVTLRLSMVTPVTLGSSRRSTDHFTPTLRDCGEERRRTRILDRRNGEDFRRRAEPLITREALLPSCTFGGGAAEAFCFRWWDGTLIDGNQEWHDENQNDQNADDDTG